KCGLSDCNWWMVSLTLPPAKCCGSGKLGTPLERMQRANATSPFCVAVALVVVEDGRFATPDVLPPPQPATSTETAKNEVRSSVFIPFAMPPLVRVVRRGPPGEVPR